MPAWSSSWQLPDQIADVLPSEARHIEELRRLFLDTARSYGYELVMPPLLEHLESLLTGTGEALDLQTFKLVDQLSGRTLGLRADTTPQVARIDAHLLNRSGVARLCYCGPVLHTRADRPLATREPLQFGAEIYGHAGLEADLEAQLLAIEGLRAAGVGALSVDMADVRIVSSLLDGVTVPGKTLALIHAALASKDASELDSLLASIDGGISQASRAGLNALLQLYGDEKVLVEAEKSLPSLPGVREALQNLKWLAARVQRQDGSVQVSFDLADLRGYAYYSGTRFAIYGQGAELARGGRYDEVGAVFGRNRPAAGFSLDLKELVSVLAPRPLKAAIRAPWGASAPLQSAIAQLRAQGETVVCVLPGHEHEVNEFDCDRELAESTGQWVVRSLDKVT
ncbi:MAG: ATP phosphoribosyltransferase regulatory subunit [Polaromonas sp. 39-63-203]|jgi:ATP phosphoribosyltransferase regulatory subunit|uniref:ATP phosphoribosyltransferase regulatory subunit n=1 Tax=Polaromonas sp. TaxID=1869339 RepID=UPI000BCD6823|nr:ATP phosphoribosyltransferase regulatory subunit [Polaromonas sp.]OYY53050.1 MAG: ATP phosphoribosyltransferase regulatory subunit [Polaromonas sp. 35-63-240]OYZ02801.1 MAG: ATP phosphoribosyltransferase regulatory subunit [Polaromonas sp. 28-63-22]OYZ84938.1 MAG: ATP phosphoribosyltransferase regulatory subunit [Polaromonas sp. 24-62-144]OZB02277.1 MAG: ATP phosphoribosyltransferase regulatory subunit [Polaromonas sp. 39-63-203]HQS30865.1 ATP phosphoribosyltransferase regulatory subunit [P